MIGTFKEWLNESRGEEIDVYSLNQRLIASKFFRNEVEKFFPGLKGGISIFSNDESVPNYDESIEGDLVARHKETLEVPYPRAGKYVDKPRNFEETYDLIKLKIPGTVLYEVKVGGEALIDFYTDLEGAAELCKRKILPWSILDEIEKVVAKMHDRPFEPEEVKELIQKHRGQIHGNKYGI